MEAEKVSEGAARAGTKARAKGTKPDYTFISEDMANKIVNPILRQCAGMLKREGTTAVPGNLNRLRMTMVREERGYYGDTRTPIWKKLSYEQIAKLVTGLIRNNLRKIDRCYRTVPKFGSTLLSVEDHQAEKISDRGHFPPSTVWMPDKINEIYKDKTLPKSFNRAAWNQTMKWLSSLWTGQKINVKSDSWKEAFETNPSKTSYNPLNPDSSSGWPDYVRKWYHRFRKDASFNQWLCQQLIILRVSALWRKFYRAKSWLECRLLLTGTAFQRTNVGSGHKLTEENTYKGKSISKLRVVIGVDKRDTCLGKPILNRLIDVCKQIRNPDGTSMFSALSSRQVIDKTMQIMLNTAKRNKLIVLSTDFSGFDATINPYLMMDVAKAVSNWMEGPCVNIFLGLVWSEFFNCRTIAPCGIWEAKPSSMKSGTIFTNILDSLYNLASQRYGVFAGFYEDILDHNVQGDDANIVGHGVNPKSFSECVSTLGLVGNEDKQYYEEDTLAFCQMIHVLGYPGGIYPISRCTASIVSTEDDVRLEPEGGEKNIYSYIVSYRTVCRLENSCFNPAFAQFVEMVANEDKVNHLGRDKPAQFLAKAAGSYADKYERYYKDFPWKSFGSSKEGFARSPVNRVLRGEVPPPPGVGLWEWVYGVKYSELTI
jgi:hypothetical protein